MNAYVEPSERATKRDAAYRHGSITRRCGICTFMLMDGTCQIVQGKVKPNDVCDLFVRARKGKRGT